MERNDEQLLRIVLAAAEELNVQLDNRIEVERGADALLYGQEGPIDSIGLVSLVVLVEQAIEEAFGVDVLLATDKAMSQRHSPFASAGSLAAYAAELVQEQLT